MPSNKQALYNRGITFKEIGMYDEALHDLNKALEIDPRYVRALIARSNVFEALRRPEEAFDSCDLARDLDPTSGNVQLNKALILLRHGRFLEGFELYEHRWKSSKFAVDKREVKPPLWLGDSPLRGRTILLHSEQGLGDTIQFCRYAEMVKDLGCTVILEAQRPLLRLLTTLKGPDLIIERGTDIQNVDLYCPLMSLPFAFRTEENSIPARTPYLQPPESAWVDRSAQTQGKQTARSIGVCWSGNPKHEDDHNRSLRLMDLQAHLVPEVRWVCLQTEVSNEEQEIMARLGIENYSKKIKDFADTAALISTLDAVISVDSSVAHLSGAMGVPTMILLPFVPDFRWMWDRVDSPWYPTVKLFRQKLPRSWEEPITELFKHLRRLSEVSGTETSCPK